MGSPLSSCQNLAKRAWSENYPRVFKSQEDYLIIYLKSDLKKKQCSSGADTFRSPMGLLTPCPNLRFSAGPPLVLYINSYFWTSSVDQQIEFIFFWSDQTLRYLLVDKTVAAKVGNMYDVVVIHCHIRKWKLTLCLSPLCCRALSPLWHFWPIQMSTLSEISRWL